MEDGVNIGGRSDGEVCAIMSRVAIRCVKSEEQNKREMHIGEYPAWGVTW